MKFTERIKTRFPGRLKHMYARISPRSPVYVFHHIPRCGGSSVNEVLASWFITIKDYRSGWTMDYPEKVNIERLRSAHCLCGHFELDGYHLHQRYPGILGSDRFRLFTFVREPLQVQLSLYRYEKKQKVCTVGSIEDRLSARPNYVADRLPATQENYKEIIDRYFFVGILEEGQASLDLLARILGKPRKKLPWANRTRKDSGCDEVNLSEELIGKFREENVLDYLIYEYCVEKFRKNLAEQAVGSIL